MYRIIKRFLDIIFSIILLIALSPILVICFIAVKLNSPGPAIFKQTRLCKNGKPFTMYKYRSMYVNSEHTGTGVYSYKGDKRVTKVGNILRKTSLDELPQLVNILKGEMSFIGPRPVLTYHPWPFEEYNEKQKRRFNVRPGITGLAQVNGRKASLWENRLEYDVEYADNLSFALDFKIFFKTIVSVLKNESNENVGETSERKNVSDSKENVKTKSNE